MSTRNQILSVVLAVPQGYELTGEFRQPEYGENFLLNNIAAKATTHVGAYPILRKTWKVPKWMPEGCWLYRTSPTGWYLSSSKPHSAGNYYSSSGTGSSIVSVSDLAKIAGDTFIPPTHSSCLQVKHDSK